MSESHPAPTLSSKLTEQWYSATIEGHSRSISINLYSPYVVILKTRSPTNTTGGINTQALDRGISWDFNPAQFKVGDHISGGDIFGSVYENSLIDNHKIMLPPRAMGTITNIVEKGSYTVDVSFDLHLPRAS